MWVLITLILKTTSLEENVPVYLQPIIHDTIENCELNIDKIHSDLTKLKYNYPVDVKILYDQDKNKYLKFTYKTDYTKPEEIMYYHCRKI